MCDVRVSDLFQKESKKYFFGEGGGGGVGGREGRGVGVAGKKELE